MSFHSRAAHPLRALPCPRNPATASPEQRYPIGRLASQLRVNAELSLWPDFQRSATLDWLEPLKIGLLTIGRPQTATLVLAVIRGLLMDIDATGDTTRAKRAFAEFLALIALPETPQAEST
jgi:hypothetical protein